MKVKEIKTKLQKKIIEYLNMIRPYLRDIINDHKTQGEWKIQLTITTDFNSSKGSDETRTVHTISDNIEILIGNKTSGIIGKLFNSPLQKCQEGLEESMRGDEFIFDSVDLLYYKLQNISLKKGRSYIDASKWLMDKKATISPRNKDDKCFKYAVAVTLNYEQIKSHPERISKFKPFID